MPANYKSLTISFKPDSLHLYNHLKQQDNKSAYILRLIREDMEKQVDKQDLRAEVLRILDELKKSNQFSINFNSSQESAELSKEDIDLINNFF